MRAGKLIYGGVLVVASAAAFFSGRLSAKEEEKSEKVFEMRTYVTNDGKLDALNARFRDHTNKLFEKHGIKLVGYWVPTDGDAAKNTLIYILEHKSRAAAAESWKAFGSDPEWKVAREASEKAGPILKKRPEAIYMKATDYSPIK